MKKKKPDSSSTVIDMFFDRDLSWLSFNERVLTEAQQRSVPLMERIRFLAIYSSNLDEFYRVRMPVIKALSELEKSNQLLAKVNEKILQQQQHFGEVIKQILQEIREYNIEIVYNQTIPEQIVDTIANHFIHSVAAYIQIVHISNNTKFFPENNKLYLAVITKTKGGKTVYIVNIPSDALSRFFSIFRDTTQYIIFLDDVVKSNLHRIFSDQEIIGSYAFKITRDAELDLQDESMGNLSRKIENKISQRDKGLATRFLYQPGLPDDALKLLKSKLNLKGVNFIRGGTYHNLRDLSALPLKDSHFNYEVWPQVNFNIDSRASLFEEIKRQDILLHPPYHTYETVLRFFNEAAIDPSVERIYVTLYRVASDSRIANALISASKNGKKVTVFVELKARFDEANNIKWSKKMKMSGVQIIESIPGLKVHAKIALVKRRVCGKTELLGLLATGNFNENTAKYYTDHILMTSHEGMLNEAETLFGILKKRKKRIHHDKPHFKHLLVGQFNLQQRFIELIDREIGYVAKGLPASITIKFNNLEDRVLISKLYEASNAGVKISLIIRGICCIVPGKEGISANITVRRIVDRYLEHGRVFIFNNNNDPEVYLGSADWMNRNIYRRIEVCFPVNDPELKSELIRMINTQLMDNAQAVTIDDLGNNVPIINNDSIESIRSQKEIAKMLPMPGG